MGPVPTWNRSLAVGSVPETCPWPWPKMASKDSQRWPTVQRLRNSNLSRFFRLYIVYIVWYVWVYSTYFWKVKKSGAGMVLMLVTNLPASPSDPIFVEHVWYFRSSWKRRTPKSDCKRMMLNSSCLPFPCSISIWACLKPAIPMDYYSHDHP